MQVLRLFFQILIGLAIAGGQTASAQEGLEKTLSSFGYIIKNNDSVQSSVWEKAQYQTLAKRVIKIKSIQAVPGWSDAFYRFTVIEERYADARSAEMRLPNLWKFPPDVNLEDQKAFSLRTGFRHGKNVYIVSTDVAMFETEMRRIAKALKVSLR
jgi:hypothetical protein